MTACGGSSGGGPVTEPGQSIANASFHTLVVQNSGGGLTQPPSGSTCAIGAERYSLTLASLQLRSVRCIGNSTTPYHEVSGTRLLTTAEFYDFQLIIKSLIVVARDPKVCVSNQPILSVEVYTSVGDQKYIDDTSQCQIKDTPVLERSDITDTLKRLATLAGPAVG